MKVALNKCPYCGKKHIKSLGGKKVFCLSCKSDVTHYNDNLLLERNKEKFFGVFGNGKKIALNARVNDNTKIIEELILEEETIIHKTKVIFRHGNGVTQVKPFDRKIGLGKARTEVQLCNNDKYNKIMKEMQKQNTIKGYPLSYY